MIIYYHTRAWLVALLAEGVDRNKLVPTETPQKAASPSSRRAWIEIVYLVVCAAVADTSPSSRRAWIEILSFNWSAYGLSVALLAEGVDRNGKLPQLYLYAVRRPPRGGRG